MRLYWEILDSSAWRCLSATDQRAYIALARALRSTNNGDLSLTLSDARAHGITSPATLAKSLRALVAVGLIAVTRKGGCARGGHRLPTLYRLTDRDCYEVPAKQIEASRPTNDWREVKTLERGLAKILQAEAEATEKAARKKKNLLHFLADTTSKNEAVKAITTSKNEAWISAPLQKMKFGGKAELAGKPNNDGRSTNPNEESGLDGHTSKNELLSTYYQGGWRVGGWGCVGLPPSGLTRPRIRLFKTATPARRALSWVAGYQSNEI